MAHEATASGALALWCGAEEWRSSAGWHRTESEGAHGERKRSRERESTMERGDGEEKEELASPVAIQGIRTGRVVYVGGG
jgi:hypothetical protein